MVSASGQLSGMSKQNSCSEPQWACGGPEVTSTLCQCVSDTGGLTSEFPLATCPNPGPEVWCCIFMPATGLGEAASCQCDNYGVGGSCSNDDTAATIVSTCPPDSVDGGSSASSNCTHSWQAAPAPCTSWAANGTPQPGFCPVFAQNTCPSLSDPCATGPCSCPAQGGCTSCGSHDACCEP